MKKILFSCLFLAACSANQGTKTDKFTNDINKDIVALEGTLSDISPDCLNLSVIKQIRDIKDKSVQVSQECEVTEHKLKEGILLRNAIIVALVLVIFVLFKK